MRRTTIIENNINQTIASAVNGASAGMMFSVPALFILGYTDFNIPLMVLGCITGGVLGHRVHHSAAQADDRLRPAAPIPGGIAVATILKSPGAGMRKAYYLLVGGRDQRSWSIWRASSTGIENWHLGDLLGHAGLHERRLVPLAADRRRGFLSGKGGVFFIVGGYVCYWMLAPILSRRACCPTRHARARWAPRCRATCGSRCSGRWASAC